MSEDQLTLELTDHARIAYSSLGPEDRRRLDAWFDHLRNWRNDEFIRSRSRRLGSENEVFVFQTSADLLIVFKIVGDKVTVVSIFGMDSVRAFEATAERSAS